jgi:hypothetical protein
MAGQVGEEENNLSSKVFFLFPKYQPLLRTENFHSIKLLDKR